MVFRLERLVEDRGEHQLQDCWMRAYGVLLSNFRSVVNDFATGGPMKERVIMENRPEDLNLLGSLYDTGVVVGACTTFASFWSILFLPQHRVTALSFTASILGAAAVGSAVGSAYMAHGFAQGVQRIVSREEPSGRLEPSVLADTVFCPAIREFGPCSGDARCADLMRAARMSRMLPEVIRTCEARTSVPSLAHPAVVRAVAAAEVAAAAMAADGAGAAEVEVVHAVVGASEEPVPSRITRHESNRGDPFYMARGWN